LREPDFRLYLVSRLLSGSAMTLLQAAIAWQVYQISGSALQLGLLGLARFLPALGMSLIAGAIADRYDRRVIVMAAQVAPFLCSLSLLIATRADAAGLPLIYGLVLLIALASAFENPARQALLPQIVPRGIFLNAVTVSSTVQQFAFVAGPVVGGVVIGSTGVDGAYAIHVAMVAGAVVSLAFLHPRGEQGERRAVSIASITEGVQFVFRRQPLLGSMALDMFAVIFAGATALLPIYAEEILEAGPRGYGLLTSAQGVGALLMSLVMVALPPVKRTGLVLLLSVAGYGVATMAFGLSRSFPLSLLAYGMCGVTDQISVIMRQTTIQLATPDELRGRVSSVSSLFIGASNQVGSIESGVVAALTNATFAVVSGGAACIGVVALIAAKMPELRSYQIVDTTRTRPPAAVTVTAERRAGRGADLTPNPSPTRRGE
jgi:MFS family permease